MIDLCFVQIWYTHVRQEKKLHRFIFAIALPKRHLSRQFLAHIYFSKLSIIRVVRVLYIIRDKEPA